MTTIIEKLIDTYKNSYNFQFFYYLKKKSFDVIVSISYISNGFY